MAGRGKHRRMSYLAVLVGVALAAAALVYLMSIYRQYTDLRDERAALQQQLEEERVTTAELQDELDYTQTTDFIERAAREKLGWIMPGEIRIVTEEEAPASGQAASPTPVPASDN